MGIIERKIDYRFEAKYLKIVKEIVLDIITDKSVKVFLFGSRANNSFRFGSDVDIGVANIDNKEFSKIKSKILLKLEESIVPFKVDIINFSNVDSAFKETAMKSIEIWS